MGGGGGGKGGIERNEILYVETTGQDFRKKNAIYIVTTIRFFIKSPEEGQLDCPKYRDESNSLVVFSLLLLLFFFLHYSRLIFSCCSAL